MITRYLSVLLIMPENQRTSSLIAVHRLLTVVASLVSEHSTILGAWASLVAQTVESTCDAGDPGSIPGLGRSPGEENGYLLQYSLASLVAQMVKNPPTMGETWVRFLDWGDPLE